MKLTLFILLCFSLVSCSNKKQPKTYLKLVDSESIDKTQLSNAKIRVNGYYIGNIKNLSASTQQNNIVGEFRSKENIQNVNIQYGLWNPSILGDQYTIDLLVSDSSFTSKSDTIFVYPGKFKSTLIDKLIKSQSIFE